MKIRSTTEDELLTTFWCWIYLETSSADIGLLLGTYSSHCLGSWPACTGECRTSWMFCRKTWHTFWAQMLAFDTFMLFLSLQASWSLEVDVLNPTTPFKNLLEIVNYAFYHLQSQRVWGLILRPSYSFWMRTVVLYMLDQGRSHQLKPWYIVVNRWWLSCLLITAGAALKASAPARHNQK